MDASSQPDDLVLPLAAAIEEYPETLAGHAIFGELWAAAEAGSCGLSVEELRDALTAIGTKVNYGLPASIRADSAQRLAFFRSLRLAELALAQACALGREAAWERFLAQYRAPLTQAAMAIAGSATVGHELAESLYAELYGLGAADGQRRSPLASYSGRGSLMGWLRTTLAQRHVDRYRRTRREVPVETMDFAAAEVSAEPLPAELSRLTEAISRTLHALGAEDRFLLSAYFLDERTLLEIGRLLRVHEATVSRRIKRLTGDLRKRLLGHLQSGGLSRRAAEEALGTDPRDLAINLRKLLQSSQGATFSDKAAGLR